MITVSKLTFIGVVLALPTQQCVNQLHSFRKFLLGSCLKDEFQRDRGEVKWAVKYPLTWAVGTKTEVDSRGELVIR